MDELGSQVLNGWKEIVVIGTAWGSGSLGRRWEASLGGLDLGVRMELTALSKIS